MGRGVWKFERAQFVNGSPPMFLKNINCSFFSYLGLKYFPFHLLVCEFDESIESRSLDMRQM